MSSLNVVTWGFEFDFTQKVVEKLKQDSRISLQYWFGGNGYGDPITLKSLDDGKFTYTHRDLPQDLLDHMKPHFKRFQWTYNRLFEKYQEHTLFHIENEYMRYLYFFHDLFEKTPCDVVIFSYTPHTAPAYILYQMAKYRGVRTLILRCSKFANRIYHYEDIEDYGLFKTSKPIGKPKDIVFEKTHRIKWHYKGEQYAYTNLTFRKRLIRWIRKSNAARVFISAIVQDNFPFKAFYLPFLRLYRFRQYSKQLKAHTASDIDLSVPYVYFPLHLQPEVTTTMFGRDYHDQMLAVEKLSKRLPDNWWIYLKDHPRQSGYQRDTNFFKRLSSLPNVKLVPSMQDPYELIEKSQFAATVSGSAAWEAICGGKPGLVFGQPWYQTFPGIHTFNEDFSVDAITNDTFTHDDILAHTKQFLTLLGKGTLEKQYVTTLDPDDESTRDPEENAILVSDVIFKLLFPK